MTELRARHWADSVLPLDPDVALPPASRGTVAFAVPELEAQFRAEHSYSMTRVFRVVVAVIIGLVLAVVPLDLAAFEGSALMVVLSVRAALVTALAALWGLSQRWPDRLTTTAPITGLVMAAGTLALSLLYPAEHSSPASDAGQFACIALVFLVILPSTALWRFVLTGTILSATWMVTWTGQSGPMHEAYYYSALVVSFVVLMLLAVSHCEDGLRHEQFALLHRLRHLSTCDSLTGVRNRRGFFQDAEQARQRLHATGHSVAVALLDLDHFKSINDRVGHAAGDTLLQAVARTLSDALEHDDILGRLGGEEFCVVLACTSMSAAQSRGEALRRAVHALRVDTPEGPLACTASIGVSMWRSGESIDAALRRADAGMYRAKEYGRNRVACA